MNEQTVFYILIYLTAVSLIAVILTCVDKSAAKRNAWRIPEKTLMAAGFLGGALAEYVTMKIMHHKTLHKKFMIGLPLFILLHIGLAVAMWYKFGF